jgi:hypothetical protein
MRECHRISDVSGTFKASRDTLSIGTRSKFAMKKGNCFVRHRERRTYYATTTSTIAGGLAELLESEPLTAHQIADLLSSDLPQAIPGVSDEAKRVVSHDWKTRRRPAFYQPALPPRLW